MLCPVARLIKAILKSAMLFDRVMNAGGTALIFQCCTLTNNITMEEIYQIMEDNGN